MVEQRQLAHYLIDKLVKIRFEYMDQLIGFSATTAMKNKEADALYNCFVGGQVTINDLNEEIATVETQLQTLKQGE